MKPPELELACELNVELSPVMEMGAGRGGKRRIIPIVGGTVSGPLINGKILDLGADWQTVFDDGLAELDTRYAMRTDDGAIIEIINYGFRHGPPDIMAAVARGEDVSADKYYMRTHARLETGDKRYGWVNSTLFLGTGGRFANAVRVLLYAVR
jgi:hypothetical protein